MFLISVGEMAAAAAAATAATAATTNAAATAAAEEIARLQRELDEMTHWLRTAYTPQVIHPTPMDQREMDKWAAWCNSIQWGTNTTERRDHTNGPTPTPTPTLTSNPASRKGMRAHTPGVSTSFGHLASGSAQLSASAPA